MTALALAVLAVLLSRVAPVMLARATGLRQVPQAAIVLWQAVAVAAVLAAVGVVLAAPEEMVRAWRGDDLRTDPVALAAAAAAVLLAGTILIRLAVVAVRLGVGLRKRRQRQLDLLDLLDTSEPEDLRLHVLAGAVPMAYCVPGRPSRVVVTQPVLDLLSVEEVQAVVEHERSHLRARHDLVLEAFTALHVSFPHLVRSRLALETVSQLLEMLADDEASRRVGAGPLRRALEVLSDTAEPRLVQQRIARLPGGVAAEGGEVERSGVSARLRRLEAARVYVLAVAVVAVPTIVVVWPWMRAAIGAISG